MLRRISKCAGKKKRLIEVIGNLFVLTTKSDEPLIRKVNKSDPRTIWMQLSHLEILDNVIAAFDIAVYE